jgi:sugar O-acyltransferase (sialic acid O-acetyltransferase NeuD family)
MKTKKLVIVGDSAFAEIACEYFDADSPYEVCGFAVERAFLKKDTLAGLPVVPFDELAQHFPPATHEVYVAIPYQQLNRLRTRLAGEAKAQGYKLASYISSRAFVWRNVEVGEHCFIFEDNTVQPFVKIGDNNILWSGNHIGHHTVIRDNCFISSHVVISGFCDIGDNCFLGVNATIANNVVMGRDNWVTPNTIVMKSTADGTLFKPPATEVSPISAPKFFKVEA